MISHNFTTELRSHVEPILKMSKGFKRHSKYASIFLKNIISCVHCKLGVLANLLFVSRNTEYLQQKCFSVVATFFSSHSSLFRATLSVICEQVVFHISIHHSTIYIFNIVGHKLSPRQSFSKLGTECSSNKLDCSVTHL